MRLLISSLIGTKWHFFEDWHPCGLHRDCINFQWHWLTLLLNSCICSHSSGTLAHWHQGDIQAEMCSLTASASAHDVEGNSRIWVWKSGVEHFLEMQPCEYCYTMSTPTVQRRRKKRNETGKSFTQWRTKDLSNDKCSGSALQVTCKYNSARSFRKG